MAGELMDQIDTEFALMYLDEAPRKDGPSPKFREHARELQRRGLAAFDDNRWHLTDAGKEAVARIDDQSKSDFALAAVISRHSF